MAAGFSFRAPRGAEVHAFLDERLSAAAALPSAADLVIEGTLAVQGCTVETAQQVARLAPFGAGNEEPVFALPRARVVRADRVGKEGKTIRAFLEGEGGGPRLKAVCFRAKEGPLAKALLGGGPMHLAGHLRAESWNDSVSASLHVADAAALA
jgi:single-stranded-DNA-specific exonuclease